MSTLGVGVLVNTTHYIVFDMCASDPSHFVWRDQRGVVDYYMFVGRDFKELFIIKLRPIQRSQKLKTISPRFLLTDHRECVILSMLMGGSSSVVERKLPKLDIAGSIPVSRSIAWPLELSSNHRQGVRAAIVCGNCLWFLFVQFKDP